MKGKLSCQGSGFRVQGSGKEKICTLYPVPCPLKIGFTLIELTLVTVIILALVGLSIPLFKNTFRDLSAKDAAFNISKLVTYAQEKAVIGGKNYKIIFDFKSRRYQLLESGQSVDGLIYNKTKDRFGKAFILPRGLFFYDPGAGGRNIEEGYKRQVVFFPDGHCDELLIGVVDNKGTGYEITLKGFGGFVKIKEITGEFR
ncbi:MAG: hypothetical protein Q7S07_00670 [Candidatus Omnitrophota bacterium]|nr:hypothetical protein [Candidatus Omnitrophota bacterium]